MSTLTIPISKKDFELIKQGIKKRIYLEINYKYLSMFCTKLEASVHNKYNNFDIGFHLKWDSELNYDTIEFVVYSAGFALLFKNPKIEIGYGKKDTDKEQKLYFIVTWGELL
jgi:hypothetical protein